MSDYVEDNRIPIEEILKKIEPPTVEIKHSLTLNSYTPKHPKLLVTKKKLRL